MTDAMKSTTTSPDLYELCRSARTKGHPDYEPVICPDCQNIYYGGSWQKEGPRDRAVAKFRCPGCEAVHHDRYDGELVLKGSLIASHPLQLEELIRSKADDYQYDNPLVKLVSITQKPSWMIVRTTHSDLARYLGRALSVLYGGSLNTGDEPGRFIWSGVPESVVGQKW